MITATITRPTSIAAASSCVQKLSLVETVDIGLMRPPKPRTISLQPISKRARIRRAAKSKEAGLLEASETGPRSGRRKVSTSPPPDESASQYGPQEPSINPQSSAPSDVLSTISTPTATESTSSGGTASSLRLAPVPSSAKSARESQRGSSSSLDGKTITATIELLKSGCLPGDNLPLKISIKHRKGMKSLHGIIITFYRQGRIDSAPRISLVVDSKGKDAEQMKHEEYYPKSKTGLSGLSLSSAGSSSLFRKDLAQTFAPLIVDPSTLTAVVNASVRVPEDVFPTISNVPGEMISFKYFVEVVIDLGGKLAGQQRHLPQVGTVTQSFGSLGAARADGNPNMLSSWRGNIVDTDHIRREKSVVACLFEVIVGSMDSARKRGRAHSSTVRRSNDWPEEVMETSVTRDGPIHEEPLEPHDLEERYIGDEQYSYRNYEQFYDEAQYPGNYAHEGYDYHQNQDPHLGFYPPPAHAEIPVPPPEIQAEEDLSEKERVRRAEERLLPSQPPQGPEGPSTARAVALVPGTPDEQEEDLYSSEDVTPRATSTPTSSLLYDENFSAAPPIPSAPVLEDLAPGTSDDKQELERQRMLAEASAPLDVDDAEDNGGEGSAGAQHEPSAPVLTEDEEYGDQYSHQQGASSHHESLPRYER
jgi:arrestin-related trafficking adapter 9